LSLEITKYTPNEDHTNVPIENVGVKLYFSGNVTDASVWETNKDSFTLTAENGDTVPVKAVKGEKDDSYILVLAQPESASKGAPGQLAQKTTYTLTVDGELTSTVGSTLGEDQAISFTTLDQSANSKISMLLMVVMMVALIVFMGVTASRKAKAEAEALALLKANPYRVAKERGISVDAAKELIEKAKEKNKALLIKTGGKAPTEEDLKNSGVPRLGKEKPKKNVHKVKAPRPIAAAGGKYKTGRKAEAEARARAEAARKAAGAKKGSGKKSKGKKKK